jgi:hypothetical protein
MICGIKGKLGANPERCLINGFFIDRFKMFDKNKNGLSGKGPPAILPVHKARALLIILAHTQSIELSCDAVGAAMAEFAEMHQQGLDVGLTLPLVAAHFEMCPDCREELETLLAALSPDMASV